MPHALKTGKRDYIYILLLLPMIGCLIYFFRELLPEINRGEFFSNIQRVFIPQQKIHEWEHRVKVSDAVASKIGLAAAYAEQGQCPRAIALSTDIKWILNEY